VEGIIAILCLLIVYAVGWACAGDAAEPQDSPAAALPAAAQFMPAVQIVSALPARPVQALVQPAVSSGPVCSVCGGGLKLREDGKWPPWCAYCGVDISK